MTDPRRILDGIAQGDAGVFREFYDQSAERLLRFIYFRVGNDTSLTRATTSVNTPEWAQLATAPFTIPAGVTSVQLRIQLANSVPGDAVETRFDDAWLLPADAGVPNPGFETLDAAGQPVA